MDCILVLAAVRINDTVQLKGRSTTIHCFVFSTMVHRPLSSELCVQIGVVMVSCTCFAPSPSLAAMLVHRFGLPATVLTYNFGGMGCSSSLVCVDLAQHLLAALPNTLALIVNHENISNNMWAYDSLNVLELVDVNLHLML